MYCFKCGQQMKENEKKCSSCGWEIPKDDNNKKITKKVSGFPKIIIPIAIGSIAVIALIIILISSLSNDSKKILGEWRLDGDLSKTGYEFYEDGTGLLLAPENELIEQYPMQWNIQDKKLNITLNVILYSETMTMDYKLTSKKLTVTYEKENTDGSTETINETYVKTNNSSNSKKEITSITEKTTKVTNPTTNIASGKKSSSDEKWVYSDDLSEYIEIVKVYNYDKWDSRYIIIKNNSDKTVDVDTATFFYDDNGKVLGSSKSEENAIGAGCTTLISESFDGDDYNNFKTTVTAKESKSYKSVLQNLSYKKDDIEDGAIFYVTNNGNIAAEFVKGYALFLKNGELIGTDSAYFTDDDFEIKPGAMEYEQLETYEDFDTIEFYMTGRGN